MNQSVITSNVHVGAFMRMVREVCRTHGFTMYLGKGKRVHYQKLPCLGYFDDMHHPPPRYAVATGLPLLEWLPIALHEFEHLKQCVERAPAWTNQVLPGPAYAIDILGQWFAGGDLESDEVSRLIRLAREVERDCEERTVRAIVEYQLPIDPVKYAQQANSYVYYYTAMAETRAWYVRTPRNVSEILNLMPKVILPECVYEELPDGYLLAMRKYCF